MGGLCREGGASDVKAQTQGRVWDLRKLQVVQCGWSLGVHWERAKDVAGKVGRSLLIITRSLDFTVKESGDNSTRFVF